MTSGADTGARDVTRESAIAASDEVNMLLGELLGGSFHEGYWLSETDHSTMAEASLRLTDLLAAKVEAGPGVRILDIGCGIGTPALHVARTTGAAVVGVTNSPAQVEMATRNAADAGMSDLVTFQCEDAMALPFPADSFDAVMMIESIFDMPDRLAVLRQAAGVLKPGGRLALTDLLDRNPATLREAGRKLDAQVAADGRPRTIALPIRLDAYEALLREAGLVPVEQTDISVHTVAPTMAHIRRRLTDDRESLVEKFGSQLVEQYEALLPMLEATGFGYGLVVATTP